MSGAGQGTLVARGFQSGARDLLPTGSAEAALTGERRPYEGAQLAPGLGFQLRFLKINKRNLNITGRGWKLGWCPRRS